MSEAMGKRRRYDEDLDRTAQIVRRVYDEAQQLSRRSSRRRARQHGRAGKIVRAVLWAVFASVAFVPLMFALGFTLGWNGIAVLVVALLATYGGLLSWVLKRPQPPRLPALTAGNAAQGIALLPAQTGDWLEAERHSLPFAAQPKLDSITDRLDQLAPQLASLPAENPSAQEVRRLLGEELPQLISGYHKVPRALVQQPLYGGSTPERQLLDGLDTVDKQIARLHEQLAQDDLHALATHQRYLDLKYNRNGDVE
jgi:hypothetical protein